MPKPFHVLSAKQFNVPFFEEIFILSNKIRKISKTKEGSRYLSHLLNHKRAMLFFTQPSTRTFLSFQSACHILGLQTSEIRDPETSSEKKGESRQDALRTFSSYVDLIIMRSPIQGLCEEMAHLFDEIDRPVPIINAGSGADEHPTQALLDLYTLAREFDGLQGLENKTICMVGDLKRGRTVRSLSYFLSLLKNTRILFVSPDGYKIGDDLRQHLLKSPSLSFEERSNFEGAIRESDAIYMTRLQDEYDLSNESQSYKIENYSLRYDHLSSLKDSCVIMHPMPRRTELDPRIDFDKRAAYWRQERNGMWIRVALIIKIFEQYEEIMSL